jgi:hypothetical protein
MNGSSFLVCICAIIFAVAPGCSNSKKAATNSEKLPQQFVSGIKADGDASDWAMIPLLYDKELKSLCAIANDDQFLHLLLKISDQAQQIKIARNGIEVWIDLNGKKTKQTGIKYPLPTKIDINTIREEMQRQDMKEVAKMLLLQKKDMEITGFKDEINGTYNLASTTGIKAGVSFTQDGTFIYELSIPFSVFAKSVSFETPLSMGIIFKAAERPDLHGGAGMMGGGGDMHGGMGGNRPGMGNMQNLFTDNSFWYKFSLASK